MNGWIKVDFDIIRHAAGRTDNLHDAVDGLRPHWEAATIPPGCLGKLGESERVEESIRNRHEAVGHVLNDINELLDVLRDGLNACAETYEETELEALSTINQLVEGVR